MRSKVFTIAVVCVFLCALPGRGDEQTGPHGGKNSLGQENGGKKNSVQTITESSINLLESLFNTKALWKSGKEQEEHTQPSEKKDHGPSRKELVRSFKTMVRNIEMNSHRMEKKDIIACMNDLLKHAEKDCNLTSEKPAEQNQAAGKKTTRHTQTKESGQNPSQKEPVMKLTANDEDLQVSLHSDKTDLNTIVETIRNKTGTNVVMDSKAIKEGIRNGTVRTTITLKVDNMTFRNALNWITRLAGLRWTLKDEAIFITTRDNVRDNDINMKIYDVRDLQAPIPDFPAPIPGFGRTGEELLYD